MEIEIVGRHALLFDDDDAAAFVNSATALVEWNSLLIDRYDVRHLLSAPPPSRHRRRNHSPPPSSNADLELDRERYLDLPPAALHQVSDEDAKVVSSGGYSAVPFSYGSTDDTNDQRNADPGLEGTVFYPPFPVPDSLITNLPPTEKVHQIIARTALFVSKHGGQTEIVLRVKQGGNPSFGFLMPDHHLHAYFRFLVDHQDLLQSTDDGKPENEEKPSNHQQASGVGALSLLGSLYGTGEDEDGGAEDESASKEILSGKPFDVGNQTSGSCQNSDFSTITLVEDKAIKHPSPKEEFPTSRKKLLAGALKAGSTLAPKKNVASSVSTDSYKVRASSLPPISKIVEPPFETKRLVDKIVEFIMKNGKPFEAVLMEQDREHGRFPFLRPANHYHPYYLSVLHKAHEAKSTAKGVDEKDGLFGLRMDKKNSTGKGSDMLYSDSAGNDIPYDDKKEKFKMVIGKSRKDGLDIESKSTPQPFGVQVDAVQAQAILLAASRGIKNPSLGILSNSSLNCINGPRTEGGQPSTQNSVHSSHSEAACEADSSESHLTRGQKLKAERLKRARMFVGMLKSGGIPLRGSSAEPQESITSGSGAEVNFTAKERENVSASVNADVSDKNIKPEKEHIDDDSNERRSRRKYRSRSSKHEESEAEEDRDSDEKGGEEKKIRKHYSKKSHSRDSSPDDDEDVEIDGEASNKYGKKTRRSHRSSHGGDDEEGIEYKHSRKKSGSRHSYEDDSEHERDHRYSRKKHRSYHEDEEADDYKKRHKHSKKERSHHEDEELEDDERAHKYSRKKHRSNHEDEKLEDEERSHKYSRKKHSSDEQDSEYEVEERDHRSSKRKHRSHRSSDHSRDKSKRKKSRSSKHHESRHRHRRDEVSSDEEPQQPSKADKPRHGSHSEKDELEEGEIISKISDQSKGENLCGGVSRETSVDVSSSYQDQKAPPQSSDITEVSDDLRAKVRAMLMSTL